MLLDLNGSESAFLVLNILFVFFFFKLKLPNRPLHLQVKFWSENILPVVFADVASVDILDASLV